jgi:hypothetical protein
VAKEGDLKLLTAQTRDVYLCFLLYQALGRHPAVSLLTCFAGWSAAELFSFSRVAVLKKNAESLDIFFYLRPVRIFQFSFRRLMICTYMIVIIASFFSVLMWVWILGFRGGIFISCGGQASLCLSSSGAVLS